MKTRFEKATPGDYVACLLIPLWGAVIGLVAFLRGDRRRGATMMAVGGLWLLLVVIIQVTRTPA